jgi:hypothetical protein
LANSWGDEVENKKCILIVRRSALVYELLYNAM